jgi:uracil phosphoribosyltransferase
MDGSVHVVSHPVVQHKLTLMRRSETIPPEFRVLMRDVGTLLLYEATRDLPVQTVQIQTPLVRTTGHSAVAAVRRIKEFSVRGIKLICLLAAPAGIAVMQAEHPDVPIYTAAVDAELDEHAYMVPGLGDAGDRLYGTG